MKKAGFLAVSLCTLMAVGAARAEIASTTYVNNIAKTKQDKLTIDTIETYDTKHTDNDSRIPTVKVAEEIAGATADAAVAATKVQLSQEYATKTQLAEEAGARTTADTALGNRITAEETARTTADNAINTKIGDVPTGKDVVTMISEAKTAATYNDTAVKASIKTNTDAISAINNTSTGIAATAKNYTDSEINKVNSAKANKATTLAGYGITDAYTTTAADAKFQTKENISTIETIATDAAGAAKDVKYASAGAAKALADAAQTAATNAAASDATTKANTAKSEAIAAAEADATTKANKALADAKEYVDDNAYTLTAATAEKLGGVKSGGNITVATDGAVTVNQAANATTAGSATKATQDGSGNNIVDTYQTIANSKVAKDANYIKAGNAVATNLGHLDTNLKTVSDTATSALSKATAAIPQPSGTCTDCVLHYNGTTFSWEEIGR